MARELPRCLDTVIIGNGPSALILSYILHGHIPYYVGGHHDPILDSKLSRRPNLLNLTPDLYAHFLASLRYSTQALPINTLLDTLLRPNADTEINPKSCVEWRYEPDKAIPHVAIGQTSQPGGQWAENPVSAGSNVATLSYGEQLSLPGYTYADHLAKTNKQAQFDFVRPSRADLAEYLDAYPTAVGISDAVYTDIKVEDVYRTSSGFVLGSLGVRCKHLVLASGIFTVNIPPPPLLSPIAQLDSHCEPLLVIGSGFSAADVIISTPPTRKIIHIFHWAPETRPSPLRGCHHTAYPEYATVYRQMKLSALSSGKKQKLSSRSPLLRRKSNPFFAQRDWASVYEGLPNAQVTSVSPSEFGSAKITIRLASGEETTRTVGGLQYVVGRRGTLDYLSPSLRSEVLGGPNSDSDANAGTHLISARTLRGKTESETALEVAKNVFVIGSLAGDSLIRHAVGGCVFVAGRIHGCILSKWDGVAEGEETGTGTAEEARGSRRVSTSSSSSGGPITEALTQDSTPPGGSASKAAESRCCSEPEPSSSQRPTSRNTGAGVNANANGHADLHLDRRKLAREIEVARVENRVWGESGWWGGGGGLR